MLTTLLNSDTDTVPGQLSVATTAERLTTGTFVEHDTVTAAGQVIFGAWLSVTVTVNEQVAVALFAAVTTKVFVVVPTGNVEPLANPAVLTVFAPGQLSVPVGAV